MPKMYPLDGSHLTCSSALSSSSLFIEDVSVCPCIQKETHQDTNILLPINIFLCTEWITDDSDILKFQVLLAITDLNQLLSPKPATTSSHLVSGERHKRHFPATLNCTSWHFKATIPTKPAVLYHKPSARYHTRKAVPLPALPLLLARSP